MANETGVQYQSAELRWEWIEKHAGACVNMTGEETVEEYFGFDREDPGRYLALELAGGDEFNEAEVLFAYNADTLDDIVESLEGSETRRDAVQLWDLDTRKQLEIKMGVISIGKAEGLGEGLAWERDSSVEYAH